MLLLVTGQTEAAVRAGEEGRVLFRDDPQFLTILFLAYGFKGDTAGTARTRSVTTRSAASKARRTMPSGETMPTGEFRLP